jgi:hypothetical protein
MYGAFYGGGIVACMRVEASMAVDIHTVVLFKTPSCGRRFLKMEVSCSSKG